VVLVGPAVQRKPWLLLVNGQSSPGPILLQLLGLEFFRMAGWDSQSVQSIQSALWLLAPTLTFLLNGMSEA
jgi:hypothetical protein